jgi:hypothetical protein
MKNNTYSLAGGHTRHIKALPRLTNISQMFHVLVCVLTEEKSSPIVDGIPYSFRSHLRSSSLFYCLSYKQFASKRQFICPISA